MNDGNSYDNPQSIHMQQMLDRLDSLQLELKAAKEDKTGIQWGAAILDMIEADIRQQITAIHRAIRINPTLNEEKTMLNLDGEIVHIAARLKEIQEFLTIDLSNDDEAEDVEEGADVVVSQVYKNGEWTSCTFPPDLVELSEHDEDWIDVRLQVFDDGQWSIHSGDSSYDQDHRGHWGCGSLNYETDCDELAQDLLDEAMDDYAQSRSE